jgi:hypothetical protein
MGLRNYDFSDNSGADPVSGDYVWIKMTVSFFGGQWQPYGWNGTNWVDFSGSFQLPNSNVAIIDGTASNGGIVAYTLTGPQEYNNPLTIIDRIGSNATIPSSGDTNISTNAIVPQFAFDDDYYLKIGFTGSRNILSWQINLRDILAITDLCFRGNSLVTVLNKETNTEFTKLAKDIVKGDIVKSTSRGYVTVLANLITGVTTEFYLFEKDCLGENTPDHDFYATAGHPLYINGTEVKAANVPQAIKVNVEPEEVYSIMTEEREYIKINNLDVCTWEPNEWEEFVKTHNLFYRQK